MQWTYLYVAIDDLDVFSAYVHPLKAAYQKCLSFTHAYHLTEENNVWQNRLLRATDDRHQSSHCRERSAIPTPRVETTHISQESESEMVKQYLLNKLKQQVNV